MKRILSLALVVLMVVAMAVSTSAAQKTFKAAMGTPTIDGKMDDAYKAAEEVKLNVVTAGAGKTSGSAYVLWDEKNIYVLFAVKDAVISGKDTVHEKLGNTYYSDSVEFFMDLAEKPGTIKQINAAQYTATAVIGSTYYGQWAGAGMHHTANAANAKYVAALTSDGYMVEMQIPWGKDYTPKTNASIGVAFHINDDEDGKNGREGEIFANEGQTKAYSTSESYDKLVLTNAKYVKPAETTAKPADKPTSPATFDAGLIAAAAVIASGLSAVVVSKKRK